ncbi:MAG: DNA repair protein RecO [Armatimonadetes bacterium]|nr:DNA repair protein RecO [Armatimonadota bacterium]
MPTTTVEGVVLRRWDSRENDRTVSLLTRERGRLIAVARGARKARSKLAGITEPLTHSRMQLAHGRRVEYITQVQAVSSFPGLRTDYRRLLAALAWIEALDAVLPLGEPHPDVFDLCVLTLNCIAGAKEPLAPLCWADLRLMELAGFAPEFRVSVVSGKALRGQKRWLSPRAGGALNQGEDGGGEDRFSVSREVAVALAKLQDAEEPPNYMKRAPDVTRALLPFWLDIAGRNLPARKRLLE